MKIEHVEWLLKLPATSIILNPALWNRIQAIKPNPPKIETHYGHDEITTRRKVVGFTLADRKVILDELLQHDHAEIILHGELQATVAFPHSLDGTEIKTV